MNVMGASVYDVAPSVVPLSSLPGRLYLALGGVAVSMTIAEAKELSELLMREASRYENRIMRGNSDLVPSEHANLQTA